MAAVGGGVGAVEEILRAREDGEFKKHRGFRQACFQLLNSTKGLGVFIKIWWLR